MLELKEKLRQILQDAGISADNSGNWKLGDLLLENHAYISLRQVTAEQGAMYRYLGCDEDGSEIYGMLLTVKFAVVLLTPKAYGGYGAEEFAEEAMNAILMASGQLGARDVVCSEAGYDSLRDCFRQEILVESRVLAYGTETDSGILLTGFRIRAEMR